MKITKNTLKKMGGCKEGFDWLDKYKPESARALIKLALKQGYYDDLNWFVARIMNHRQQTKYAVYAAGLVIGIYEKKYPNDNRPRNAIRAAKRYITNADIDTANAAVDIAIDIAIDIAADAAAVDIDVADAALSATVVATVAAVAAVAAVGGVYAARNAVLKKCIRYAYRMLIKDGTI